MTTKILHIRFKVQIEEKPPQELIENYLKGVMRSPDEARKCIKELLPDVEAVIEKIIKPGIKGSKRFLNQEAVTTTGTKLKDIPLPTQAEMKKQARKYLKSVAYAFRNGGKEYVKIVEVMADLWGKKMLSGLAITGYKNKIRGVGPLVACCLTNIQTALPLILPEEFIKKAPLVNIAKPRQGGILRMQFNSKIISVGKPIIVNKCQPGDIIYANEQINRLVNAYARDEFVPFTPGGDSHVDFMMVDGELFLDVQVAVAG